MSTEPLQVYIVHAPMVEAFHRWVETNGWHLQGPVVFTEGDMPTHFLQPLPSEEALSAYLREVESPIRDAAMHPKDGG